MVSRMVPAMDYPMEPSPGRTMWINVEVPVVPRVDPGMVP
jgi:hypothetical protein